MNKPKYYIGQSIVVVDGNEELGMYRIEGATFEDKKWTYYGSSRTSNPDDTGLRFIAEADVLYAYTSKGWEANATNRIAL